MEYAMLHLCNMSSSLVCDVGLWQDSDNIQKDRYGSALEEKGQIANA